MGKGFDLEDLEVFRLAETLADTVWDIVVQWRNLPRDTVGKQLVRAVDSVGANIAEGFGKGSYQDNRRFVKIARGSLYETRYWLRRAQRRHLLTPEQAKQLRPLIQELPPRLNAYLNSIGPRQPATRDKGPGTRDKNNSQGPTTSP